MAQIQVIRDPNIPQTDIVHSLMTTSSEELGEENLLASSNQTMLQQTKVYGVMTPIIAVNGVGVAMRDLDYFSLDHTDVLPMVVVGFWDRANIFKNFVDNNADGELRIQILPPAENMYKKINLTFSIVDCVVGEDGYIEMKGEYKLTPFTESTYESLGLMDTYELCDHISLKTGLGFAANVKVTGDERFMECRYTSLADVMRNEIKKSKSDALHVYDYWVDLNNNLTLCDLYDRFTNKDAEKDMMVWMITNQNDPSIAGEVETTLSPAIFTNVVLNYTNMKVNNYEIINTPVVYGNNVVISTFSEYRNEFQDHYIGNGDVEHNVAMKFEYMGECYDEYNYLLAEKCREVYKSKIMSEVTVIKVSQPQFGIIRGDQIKFLWYDNQSENQMVQDDLNSGVDWGKDETIFAKYPQLMWLKEYQNPNESDIAPMRLDLIHSGQYTVIGQKINFFAESGWDVELHCIRPLSDKPQILPKINPNTNKPFDEE